MSNAPDTVGDYDIIRPLGEGSQGQTFLGRAPDGSDVVLKRFSIRQMRDWKSLELFQREIVALRMLDHVAIPAFVDDVELDGAHYLVQAYIEGDVLSEVAATGPRPEDELVTVARDVLEVLSYLHELNPPVVHRDVKPSNIIRGTSGRHTLVDFGGVQMIVAQDTGGSTVIGTTGYMPSEQLIGRAEPRSDLYALGATLAHLATGVHPSQLPTKRLRIDWRSAAPTVSGPIADLIDQLLEPAPEDRPESAEQALASLPEEVQAVAAVPQPAPTSQLTEAPRQSWGLVPKPQAPTAMRKRGSIPKPKGHCPRTTNQRFMQKGESWVVDLSPKVDSTDVGISIGLMAAGFTMSLVMWHWAPVVLGIVFAALNVIATWARPSAEELEIAPDGRFLHKIWDEGSEAEVRGRLGDYVSVRSNRIALVDEGDDDPKELFVGSWLSGKERHWVAWRVQLVLEALDRGETKS